MKLDSNAPLTKDIIQKSNRWPWKKTHFILSGCKCPIDYKQLELKKHFVLKPDKILWLLNDDYIWCKICGISIYNCMPEKECTLCY